MKSQQEKPKLASDHLEREEHLPSLEELYAGDVVLQELLEAERELDDAAREVAERITERAHAVREEHRLRRW